MKYIKLLEDVADEKHEYDIEEFELLGNMKYGVIDEGINFYKIKNQFNEIKKYDKDLFSLMLNSDEILVKEFDDLRGYDNSINERGCILSWPEVMSVDEEYLELIDEDQHYILAVIQQPEHYLKFDDFVKIINCYGFNFKVDKNENTDS